MPIDPYAPPRSEVGTPGGAGTSWQTRSVSALLALWAVAALVMSAFALFAAGAAIPLSYYYLFTAEPMLLAVASYLLWGKNRYGLLFLALAIAARVGVAAAFRYDFGSRTTAPYVVELFSRIPLGFMIPTAAEFALLVYGLFLVSTKHLR
jgi:hypothetical protein